jgi:hypothetical protein
MDSPGMCAITVRRLAQRACDDVYEFHGVSHKSAVSLIIVVRLRELWLERMYTWAGTYW